MSIRTEAAAARAEQEQARQKIAQEHRKRWPGPKGITPDQVMAAVGTGARGSDVARRCDIAASTAHHWLLRLRRAGKVWQDSLKYWHPTKQPQLGRIRRIWFDALCEERGERGWCRLNADVELWCAVCSLQAALEVHDG